MLLREESGTDGDGRAYWMVMLPSFTVATGRLVRPSASPSVPLPSWFVVTVTVNGTFWSGSVPSPMSIEHEPEKMGH